jgi:hypothetical protein
VYGAPDGAVLLDPPSMPARADLRWAQTLGRCGGVAVTHSEVGHADAAGWADAFRKSDLGTAVFDVSRGALPRVLEWAEHQSIPRAARRSVHTPSVDAWAVLDGGIVHVYGYGLTSLPAGVRVIGLQAFRLVLSELGYLVPDGLTEASTVPPVELRRRLQATPADHPSGLEQADLLASCTDAVLMRWVAATLLAEYGISGSGP